VAGKFRSDMAESVYRFGLLSLRFGGFPSINHDPVFRLIGLFALFMGLFVGIGGLSLPGD
jgi:hypothetical protein